MKQVCLVEVEDNVDHKAISPYYFVDGGSNWDEIDDAYLFERFLKLLKLDHELDKVVLVLHLEHDLMTPQQTVSFKDPLFFQKH